MSLPGKLFQTNLMETQMRDNAPSARETDKSHIRGGNKDWSVEVKQETGYFSMDSPVYEPLTTPNTIFYVKTETHQPGINNITYMGPSHSKEGLFLSIALKVKPSPLGFQTLEDLVSDGLFEIMKRLDAPLPDGNTLTIHMEQQENAKVAAKLPGPTYNLMVAEISESKRSSLHCKVCRGSPNEGSSLKQCSKCRAVKYCSH